MVKWWPFGVASNEALLLVECVARCCDDLNGFVIVDQGRETFV